MGMSFLLLGCAAGSTGVLRASRPPTGWTTDPGSNVQSRTGRLRERFEAPLHGGHVSSVFGYRRNPITGGSEFHRGVDIAAPVGTRVGACWPGRVEAVYWTRGSGRQIRISHPGGLMTVYKHLSSVRVAKGRYVDAGDWIGDSGNSGTASTGPHLHLETLVGGRPVDPGGFDSRLDRPGLAL